MKDFILKVIKKIGKQLALELIENFKFSIETYKPDENPDIEYEITLDKFHIGISLKMFNNSFDILL